MKKHFYLVTGQIVFVRVGDGANEIGNTPPMNALLMLNKKRVSQSVLKEAQARLATSFANRVQQAGDDFSKMTIVDIVLGNINYLGEMLPKEFYDVQPANDSEASETAPAIDLARTGRDSPLN